MKRVIYICAVILFIGIFAFSAWQLLQIGSEYRKGEKEYERLEQYVVIPEAAEPVAQDTQVVEGMETIIQPQENDEILWPVVDFASLQMLNPDVVGWIYIPDTKVNYPIVQGRDNDQYLYHLLSGEYNSSGSIFLDAAASSLFSSRNNPIYGHNMKNGSMFADMTNYKTQKFYDEHPVALLLTPEKNYKIHIFSAYVTDAWDDAWQLGFEESEYVRWLEKLQRQSYIATDVIPSSTDTILTFSTCTYETDDARFLVHGIMQQQ